MINEYFWQLAQVSAQIAGLSAKLIYAQWVHETWQFTSDLCVQHNNFGGITQEEPNDLPQPDGELWYRHFDSPDEYADYFGRYLRLYEEDGIYQALGILEYAQALKHGNYFGASVEEYVKGMTAAYHDAFGCEYSEQCTCCAGHIDDPFACARYQAAVAVGIDAVPADIGPIDYQQAQMVIENARQ